MAQQMVQERIDGCPLVPDSVNSGLAKRPPVLAPMGSGAVHREPGVLVVDVSEQL